MSRLFPWRRATRKKKRVRRQRAPATMERLAELTWAESRLTRKRDRLRDALAAVPDSRSETEIDGDVVAVDTVAKRLADTEVLLYAAQRRRASMAQALGQPPTDDSTPSTSETLDAGATGSSRATLFTVHVDEGRR